LASSADSIRASNDVNEQAKENALVLAVALEQISNHPMAAALRSALPESGKAKLPLVHDAVHRTGQGIAGTIAGVRLTLGRGQDNSAKALADRLADEDSQCVLADEYGPLAVFHCDDPLREDAPALVASLRERGMHPMLVSGDGPGPVRRAALRLGIDDTHAFATPQDKQALVRLRQARGEVVAMIGDGLNDAPVIAQADVSATLASAATLAQTSADFIVLSNRLEDLNAAFGLSARALNVMRGNLLWALGYNVVAIPVAALGYVSPLWASIGMATSSLVVVANALRLLPAQKGT
jgi:Cu2+-exporting ATPase